MLSVGALGTNTNLIHAVSHDVLAVFFAMQLFLKCDRMNSVSALETNTDWNHAGFPRCTGWLEFFFFHFFVHAIHLKVDGCNLLVHSKRTPIGFMPFPMTYWLTSIFFLVTYFFQVIECYPLVHSKRTPIGCMPFPTMYWLTSRLLQAKVSELEFNGMSIVRDICNTYFVTYV